MSKKPIDPAVVLEFVSTIRGLSSKSTDDKRYLTGTVTHTDPDGTVWVSVAGGVGAMPVTRSTASYSPGDVVSFSIEDGVASMGGNVTDPAAGGDKVVNVTKHVNLVENQLTVTQNIVAGKAEIADLNAARATIGELQAADVTITGQLTAATGRIETLESDNVTIDGRLDAAEADIDDLEAEDARIGNLVATKADIADLTAATGRITTLESTKANISDLEANYITAAAIEAQYMHANMSNSDVAWISNGVIANGAISSAMINDVSANKLTAGTINGSVINVTNLNADNITAGTINGQRIGAGSLSLDKLSEDVYTEAEVDAMLDTMQSEIDGAIETWTGTAVPTLNNAPASSWTTAADRDKHVGDVYFNTTSGYNYRFTKSGTGSSATYSWLQIKDTDITNALQRIQTAEGKITTFDSDISTLKTDTGELKTKTQSLETSLGDKVDTTTFNELSSTVDENSATITTHSTVLSNNGLTSTTNITNTVNSVSQTATSNSSKISQLTTTLGTNADGTSAANDVVHRVSDVEQDLDGITTRVSKTEAHIAGDFALSTTVAGTTAKTATITPTVTGWTLEKGVSVTVRFDKENTVASPTLNVNSTGAKAIRDYAGNALAESAYKWKAGTAYSFTYDGTYWRLQDSLLTARVTQAESTITQQADLISAKVSKDGVIAAINLSTETEGGSAAKISADKVNITGTAIFSALGSNNKVVTATQTQWYSSTSATTKSGGSWGTTQPSVVAGRYIWQREYLTYSDDSHEYKPSEAGVCVQGQTDLSAYSTTEQVETAITSKGYQTAAQVSTAVANGTANLAAKADAVAETQRIYYRSKVSGTVTSPGTTWVTANGNIWNDTATVGVNGWTTKVTPMSKDKTLNTDANKYLYLYTAIQKKTVSGSVTTTTVLLDDSTTIIDGGNIITGSVTANQLSANSVTADKIASNAITVGKMPSADQASILNSNVTISNVNGLQDALNGKETAGAAAAVQQTLETTIDGVAQEVQNKADGTSLDSTNDDLTQLVAGLSTSDHFNVNDDGTYTFGLDDALDGVEQKAAQDLSQSETALNNKIDANVTDLQSKINEASQANLYIHESTDGLEIGKNIDGTAGAFRQLMDDQGTHWQYNRDDAAYVGVNDEGKGTMFLDEAQVTGRLRVGNYIFMGNDAGTRMSLKWIGD